MSRHLPSLLLVALALGCAVEHPPDAPEPTLPDVQTDTERGLGLLAARLHPPALVFDHQARIGLSEAQRAGILDDVRRAQARLLEDDAALRGALETLTGTLGGASVDAERALAEADLVLDHERRIKRTHFEMLLRIRARLTEVQRAQLDAVRSGGH